MNTFNFFRSSFISSFLRLHVNSTHRLFSDAHSISQKKVEIFYEARIAFVALERALFVGSLHSYSF